MLKLPATPADVLAEVILPAAELLPAGWNTPAAQVMILAIMQQESGLATRVQYGNGPARGLAQFEQGTQASRGGVWGIYLHSASREPLESVCALRGVPFNPRDIWAALEHDDILAACCSRLLLRTDPRALPPVDDPIDPAHHVEADDPLASASWRCYFRNWRPGKPHIAKWPTNHRRAREAVEGTFQ